MLKKFVEIFKNTPPTTAREFMGLPIHMEYREISAVEDDRIMADGRPAYAWWNEIQMLRQREPDIQRREMALREKTIVLRVAEWAMRVDMLTGDTLLRIKQMPLTTSSDPALELLKHPEKYVTKEK